MLYCHFPLIIPIKLHVYSWDCFDNVLKFLIFCFYAIPFYHFSQLFLNYRKKKHNSLKLYLLQYRYPEKESISDVNF